MKRFFKKLFEKIIEGILFLSSTVTSLAIVLIVIFLFREGFSLFGHSPVEEGFIIAVNSKNPVSEIKASQIKDIFDGNITSWKELGGNPEDIILFRVDDITNYFTEQELGENLEHVPAKVNELIEKTPGIIAFIPEKFTESGFTGKTITTDKITVGKF